MTSSALLAEDAQADIEEVAIWYAAHGGAALAARFLDALGSALDQLERFPEMHPVVHPGIRRAFAAPFPYALLYEIERSAIVVHRCIHAHRDPVRWSERRSRR